MRRSFLFILLLFVMGGCSKKGQSPASSDDDIMSFSILPGKDSTSLASYAHSITVYVPTTVTNGSNLAAIFKLSPGASATVGGITQISGITKNDFNQTRTYLVTAADGGIPMTSITI